MGGFLGVIVGAGFAGPVAGWLCWRVATVVQVRRARDAQVTEMNRHLRERDHLADRAKKAARERDGYGDALAAVVSYATEGLWEEAVAHARQALELGGGYTGQLAAAREALEEAEGDLKRAADRLDALAEAPVHNMGGAEVILLSDVAGVLCPARDPGLEDPALTAPGGEPR